MSDNKFDKVLPDVVNTIRAATSLAAQDINFYRSLDSQLAKSIDSSGNALLDLTNKLLETSNSSLDEAEPIPFGKDNLPWKNVVDMLDFLYEKVDTLLDQANSSKQTGDQFTYLEDGTQDARAPSKAISKPQLDFDTKVDNSESQPFKPKISSKPNSIVPFEDSMTLVPGNEEDEEPPHYEHPYEFEIDNQPYPDEILLEKEPIEPESWNNTSANWVDTIPKLHEMVKSLQSLTEIAVDLEHHDYRTYYGLVCLMQISNRKEDWIVDTLKLRGQLEILNVVFTDPKIVKVFHGAFMDIIWLQRDLGLYVVSLFDTYHASKKLGFPKFSLAYLLETLANFKTSKKYQLADWRARPLLLPMMSYARSDTHFLLNIYDQLRNKLINKGEGRLQEVLYESRQVSKRRFEYTKFRPLRALGGNVVCPVMSSNPKEPFSNLMAQYRIPYHKKPLVQALYEWRDKLAKIEDESVRYIMPNQLLVSLCLLELPVDSQKVLGSSSYISDSVRVNSKELATLIQGILEDMDENDWDLVDKLSNTVGNDSAFINEDELDPNTIKMATKAFDKLNSNLRELEDHDSNSDLLNNDSSLLSDILNKQENQFSVEYNIATKSLIKHSIGETKERIESLLEHFHKVKDIEITPQTSTEAPLNSLEILSTENATKQSPDTVTLSLASDSANADELITLRKKNTVNNIPRNKVDAPIEESFDYANADKIMLDAKKTKSRKDNSKKRSFDPYANTGDGPQSAKKSKRVNNGKTSTFSTKRK